MRDRYVTVGQSVRRVEGFEKVTGRAVYVDDISFPDMLHAAILKSPYAHAKIVNIDVSKALKLPGVKAVITGKDAAEAFFKRRGEDLDRWDRNCVLSVKKVRYVNEPVAAVAAIDKDIALEALDLIEVEYEELPAVFSPEEALKEGAPLLHEGKKDNVGTRFRHEFGDVAKGLEEAYYVREDTCYIPPMAHVCMEPRGTVAKYDPVSGKLTLWSSHQAPFILRAVLARTLGWEESRIRVIKPYVGSGFGGKMAGVAHLPILELFPNDICAALLAIKTGRPVKLVLTREEEFTITRLSQPMIIKLKTGVRKDGSIVAKDIDILIDGGAYDSPIGAGVNYLSSIWLTLPYKQENFRFDIKRVFTNKPISGALRGYAARETLFAQETHMDRLANDIGMDPVDLRLKNVIGPNYVTPNGLKVTTCGLREAIEKVVERVGWKEKKGKLPPGKGIGISICGFGSGTVVSLLDPPGKYTSACMLRITHLGEVIIYTGLADIGQGSDTVMCQIAAEELGVKLEDVKIVSADTDLCPPDAGTFSSKGTVHGGNAVRAAASSLKRKLLELVAGKIGVGHDELDCKEGIIFSKRDPEKKISFKDAIRQIYEDRRGQELVASGVYQPPLPESNFYITGVGNYAPNYSFGAQAAEVEVDEETGEIKVERVIYAHDAGFPINPRLVEGQLEGAVVMALGGGLCEEIKYDDTGRMLNPNLIDYTVPRAPETPKIEVIHVVTDDPNGPFGAKECGEGTTSGTAPAIANAVFDALGIALDLPLTKEKVLKALKEQKGRKLEG
ncbi:4-hydroxybenzoyl-CoA reductase [Thermococci archaeon]|nr:MAG: 4-hydroxybenzoyl-CoA reductase [Thermococci archaeon]